MSVWGRLEHIDEVERRLGWSHIVVTLVVFQFLAAFRTFKLVRTAVGVTQSQFSLEVPVLGKGLGISVCHSCSNEPSFVSIIFQFGKVCS